MGKTELVLEGLLLFSQLEEVGGSGVVEPVDGLLGGFTGGGGEEQVGLHGQRADELVAEHDRVQRVSVAWRALLDMAVSLLFTADAAQSLGGLEVARGALLARAALANRGLLVA